MNETEIVELVAVLLIGYMLLRSKSSRPAAPPQNITTNNITNEPPTNGWDAAVAAIDGVSSGVDAYLNNN